MKHLELGFIGFGLIGGSIARALKKHGLDISVTVYTRRVNPHLDKGQQDGVIDHIVYDIDDSFSNSDIIFLCAPVIKNADYLPLLKKIVKKDCIITDVGSVKGTICEAAAKAGLVSQFIGGHPMAGSEKTGYENSTDTLLENAYYLLTPGPENSAKDIDLLKELVTITGANCVILSCEEHDRITAAISHVPHIIAVTLVNMVRENDNDEQNMKSFAAGGFKDITRIASSSPAMWQDICMANKESIDYFLTYFQKQLQDFQAIIREEKGSLVYDKFEEAGTYRNSIPSKKSSVIARSYELFVNIDDRAGAIATVATVLSVNGISIKNIGIVHNREFTDGVLHLELYTEKDALTAKRLLSQNNYTIVTRD